EFDCATCALSRVLFCHMLSLLFDWQAPVVFIESNVLTFDPARSRKDAGIVATLRKGTKQKPRDVALGHVWTAPPWQELSDASATLVGCGHVCGLFVRPMWPLAIMLCADRVPIVNTHFKDAMTQAGSPDPRIDLVCITSSCPRQFFQNVK